MLYFMQSFFIIRNILYIDIQYVGFYICTAKKLKDTSEDHILIFMLNLIENNMFIVRLMRLV